MTLLVCALSGGSIKSVLTEFSSCLVSWALQPTTCGHPLKANSSRSASILSFSSLCAWTICFSLNWTWAKWEVSARREEFSKSCSSSSLLSREVISSSLADVEHLCLEWAPLPLPQLPLSSSGLATAPTGAHRSPAPASTASLSEADSSSVDIFEQPTSLRNRVRFNVDAWKIVYFLMPSRKQVESTQTEQVQRHLRRKDDSYVKTQARQVNWVNCRKLGSHVFKIKV